MLERVGKALGEREGTGPDHDPLLRSQRRRWYERGLEHGHERGLEHGRAEERALLCRQAARKFDDDTAQRLAVLLEQTADPDRLAQAGVWIIECETGAELLDRVSGNTARRT